MLLKEGPIFCICSLLKKNEERGEGFRIIFTWPFLASKTEVSCAFANASLGSEVASSKG